MAAVITCASCKRPLRVPEHILGQLVQCPLCLDEFIAQADPGAASAVRAAESSRKHAVARPKPITAPAQDDSVTQVEEFDESPVWTEPDDETDSPKKKVSCELRPVQSLAFPVLITRDPDRILRGRMEAELTADGLYLRKPRKAPAFAAAGGGARYLGANRIAVTVEGREVELMVVKPWTSVYHMARDTANFLGNNGDFPNGRVYDVPWLLYAAPPVFVVLPFAACPFGLLTDGCGGAFLWSLIALVLAGACFAVAIQPRLTPRTRLIGAGSLIGLGALIYLLAFLLTPSYGVEPALWRTYEPPDGGFRVKMPGSPAVTEKPPLALLVDPDDADVTVIYTVDVKEAEVCFTVFDSPVPTANDRWNRFPGGNINHFQAINEAKSRLQQEYANGRFELKSDRDLASNEQACHEMVYSYSPVGDDIGTLTKILVARVYVTNDRMYTLTVLGLHVKPNGLDVLKFFNSFQNTSIPPG